MLTATLCPSRVTWPATAPEGGWLALSNAALIAGRNPSRAAASRSWLATPAGIRR